MRSTLLLQCLSVWQIRNLFHPSFDKQKLEYWNTAGMLENNLEMLENNLEKETLDEGYVESFQVVTSKELNMVWKRATKL